ncbi:MAG TPA: ATP-binding protein [Tepidisphaeraceae bacterium]
MKSLRSGLIIRTVAACVVCFALAGAALYFSIRAAMIQQFDAALAARADSITAATEASGAAIKVESEGIPPDFTSGRDYFQLWDAAGNEVASSPSLGLGRLPRDITSNPMFLTLPSGHSGRARLSAFSPRRDDERPDAAATQPPPQVTLVVASDATGLHRDLQRTLLLILFVFTLAILGASLVMWRAVAAGLRPVGILADRIRAARTSALPDRIDLEDAPDELSPVVIRLNELLQTIECAFAREKSFTADVAHELRTPISGLESMLEVCASRERTGPEYRQVLHRCRTTVQDMHRLIEKLLLLARADSGQMPAQMQWIHLRTLVEQCWEHVEPRAKQRELGVALDVCEAIEVRSDPALLTVVLHNLFDNAANYADAAGTISIRWESAGSRLVIANSGCSLTQQDLPKVFDRFWRADSSRSATGQHAGLGLSLCRKIVTLLGASTTARIAEAGTFEVEIAFHDNARHAATDVSNPLSPSVT